MHEDFVNFKMEQGYLVLAEMIREWFTERRQQRAQMKKNDAKKHAKTGKARRAVAMT